MKNKLISAVCSAVVCLSLCSCSHSGSAKPCEIDPKFSSQVTITQNEKKYQATLTRGEADVWEMEFSEPDTVSGMKVNFTGSSCTVEFSGLKYQLDRKDISPYSMASLGCGALEKLIAKDDITCKNDDGKLIEQGVINGQDFKACFEDEKLKELTVSDQLRFEF